MRHHELPWLLTRMIRAGPTAWLQEHRLPDSNYELFWKSCHAVEVAAKTVLTNAETAVEMNLLKAFTFLKERAKEFPMCSRESIAQVSVTPAAPR